MLSILVRTIPAALSAALLAAHFWRAQENAIVLLCLALIPLFFTQRGKVLAAARGLLVLGSVEWMRTAVVLAMERQALGAPWMRMALILAGVSLFTLGSAWNLGRNASSRREQVEETGQAT